MTAKTSRTSAPAVVKKTASAGKPAAKPARAGQIAARKSATKKTSAKQARTGKPTARMVSAKPAGPARTAAARSVAAKAPVLLSGGNPQIAKGEGDAPVQAYIAAMPDWKRAMGQRPDALIVEAVPNVHKAVKWNSPLYGIRGQGWFLSFHCFDRYIKLAFFRGASLRPMPPEPSKTAHTRYLHVYENESFDEAQFVAWAKQASRLPGERM
ncbi:DUF1801 domain-containing protein [Lysobacter firmicutimachus]|uniref:DUF1801 domain-containing protein n=1 Tax=Lysobacter firmicutimachus TaxID=1792846 RepID=A0ABU8D1G9_9GAMM